MKTLFDIITAGLAIVGLVFFYGVLIAACVALLVATPWGCNRPETKGEQEWNLPPDVQAEGQMRLKYEAWLEEKERPE